MQGPATAYVTSRFGPNHGWGFLSLFSLFSLFRYLHMYFLLYFYFFPRTLSHWLNSLDLAKLPVRWHLLPRLMKDEWKVKLKTPIITCYKCVTQYIKVRIGIDWLSRNRYSVHACMSRHKQLIITWSWKNSGGNMRIFPGVKEVKDTFSQYGYRSKRTGPSSNQLWFSDSTWDALSLNVN